jgi:hypothetical protein
MSAGAGSLSACRERGGVRVDTLAAVLKILGPVHNLSWPSGRALSTDECAEGTEERMEMALAPSPLVGRGSG